MPVPVAAVGARSLPALRIQTDILSHDALPVNASLLPVAITPGTASCVLLSNPAAQTMSMLSPATQQLTSSLTDMLPDDVSMMPNAPLLDTAPANCDRPIQPIGACTMGISIPNNWVIRLSNCIVLALR